MSDVVRIHAIVAGRVQGVGFRYFTQGEATALGLAGWVRNLPGGEVQLEAEGTRERVDELIAAVRRGPALSRVDDVRLTDRPTAGGTGFRIRH